MSGTQLETKLFFNLHPLPSAELTIDLQDKFGKNTSKCQYLKLMKKKKPIPNKGDWFFCCV